MFKTTTGSTAYLKIAAQKKKRTELRAKFRRRLSPWTSEGPLLISEPQQSTRQRKRYRSQEIFKPHAFWKPLETWARDWVRGRLSSRVDDLSFKNYLIYHHDILDRSESNTLCFF